MDEQEMNDYINTFIMQWCGEYIAHLVDSDDNAGERLREKVREYADSKAREAVLAALDRVDKKTEANFATDSSDQEAVIETWKYANARIREEIEAIRKELQSETPPNSDGAAAQPMWVLRLSDGEVPLHAVSLSPVPP